MGEPQRHDEPEADSLYGGMTDRFTGIDLLTKQVPEPPADPGVFMESCGTKAVTAAFLGGGMGILFGVMLASYESIAPPAPVPGQRALPAAPLREAMGAAWRTTSHKSRSWGKNFLVITGLFTGTECLVEKARGTHDIWNGMISGCAVGATMSAKSGPGAAALGCAGFAVFSGLIDHFTGP